MILLVGDSASGKSTVEKILVERGYQKVVSYTTRPPRVGEVNGVDYNFISDEDFHIMDRDGVFVEIGAYNGWFYGSTKEQYNDKTVAVVTPHGMRCLKKNLDIPILSVYIDVPRKDRLIKMLQRQPNVDDVDECCRRSSSDVGMFDGVVDEVDLVIKNERYLIRPEKIADIIEKKLKELR